MAKKKNNLPLVLGALVAVFLMFRPKKAQAERQSTAQSQASAQIQTSTGLQSSTQRQEQKTENVSVTSLSGIQVIQDTVLYPSTLNTDTETEAAPGISWNFGMIAKTAKRWSGEAISTSTSKVFINRFAGFAAVLYLLFVYINIRKLKTIRTIGNLWASRNKEIWIQKVSEYSGFGADEVLAADTSFLFPLAYAIALYYQPQAREYISRNTVMASLDYVRKNYKINLA